MADQLPPKLPAGMSFVDGNVAANWKRFRQRLEFFFKGVTHTRLNDQRKIGILMTSLGDPGLDVYNTFKTINEHSSFAEVVEAFEEYCNPRRNTVYERFLFSQIVQGSRNVDAFVVDLKNQASKCEFREDEDDLVRDRLVVGVRNPVVRKELLRDAELDLYTAVEIARAWERSETEASAMVAPVSLEPLSSPEALDVHKLESRSPRSPKVRCDKCSYEHPVDRCPAANRECNYCKETGHFAIMCKKKPNKPRSGQSRVNVVSEADQPESSNGVADDIQVLQICQIRSEGSQSWNVTIQVGSRVLLFKLDTGAECNVMSYATYESLHPRPKLKSSLKRLRGFGSTDLIVPAGEIQCPCRVQGVEAVVSFVVVPAMTGSRVDNLIGLPTIDSCHLLQRLCLIDVAADSSLLPSSLLSEFGDVFRGLGKAPGQYELVVQADAVPVVERPRCFPYSVRDKLCAELAKLEKIGVVARVHEPTDWVSNLTVVKKPSGDLRLCLDPKNLNAALKIPKFEIPRPDDILRQLGGCRYFTVLDLRHGFWQLELSHESSLLTTFHSPVGRYRFLRLCFGVSSAPEMFMAAMVKFFGDLPGVCPYFDDLIVAGVTMKEHDNNLRNLLVRARKYNFKFNAEKVQFGLSSVNFLGFQISEKGVQPQQKHIRAICEMPQPSDKKGVLRLLGMVKYLGRFIPSLSTHTENLRNLTKKSVSFVWESVHTAEFEQLKSLIVKETSLRFYDPEKELCIQTDSSKSGVGCCLYQEGAPLAYASRALTQTECRYAQIEKELLAIVFALERFHDFTYGRPVVVVTDHRLLLSLVKKHISDVTPRLQRFRLRLMRYSFQLIYKPGKELLVADTLSRAYLSDEPADESYQLCDVHTAERVVASPEFYQQLVAETAKDPLLSLLKIYLRGGWPKSESALRPAVPDHAEVQARKLRHQATHERYYNKTAKDLPDLVPGDQVLYKKDLSDKEWRDGAVVGLGKNPRAYRVQDDETRATYLRNRRFIVKPHRFRD